MTNIIDQLEIIHGAGYIHNDIKPDNVVLEKRGAGNIIDLKFRLIDFGETVSFFDAHGLHLDEA